MDSITGTEASDIRPLLTATAEPGRLSLQPLIAHLEANEKVAFAALLGTSRVTLDKWLARGVDAWTADRLACKAARLNPISVWGSEWEDLLSVEDDEDDADA